MRFYRLRTLEDLALRVVVVNLKDNYLRLDPTRKFEKVLRKLYSDKIYEILKKNVLLDEALTNWLLSPYWTNVKIDRGDSVSNLLKNIGCYGKIITSASFENSFASIDILSSAVCLLPNIKNLNLSGTSCTNNLLSLIRKVCPELYSLNLTECNVTIDGMKNLCLVNNEKVGFDSLKVLNIEGTNVKPSEATHILKNIDLHIIKCSDMEIFTRYLLRSLTNNSQDSKKTYELREYNLSDESEQIELNRALKKWVEFFPYLKKLVIYDLAYSCDFELCSNFNNLKSFSIENGVYIAGHPSVGLKPFLIERGEKLTELSLKNVLISVDVIIRNCPNLKELSLCSMSYENFDEDKLSAEVYNLNSLTKLYLKNAYACEVRTQKSISVMLNRVKNLKSLTFDSFKEFPNVFVSYILDLNDLEKVKFKFTDIKECMAKKLFSCKNIKMLYFECCPDVNIGKCARIFCSSNKAGNTFSWQIEYDEMSIK